MLRLIFDYFKDFRFHICISIETFSDFCLAIFLIDESVPSSWFQREGFSHSRKLLLIFWLVMGNFILMGYKGTLLSNLVKIRYEDTLETRADLIRSGKKILQFEFPGSDAWAAMDPFFSQMAGKIIWYPPSEEGSEWFEERYTAIINYLTIWIEVIL